MVALKHIRPRRFLTTVELDLLDFRESTINAFREAGGVYRLACAHTPDCQARERGLRGDDQWRMRGWGEDSDVHRQTKQAQTRAARGEDGQGGGGGRARRRRKVGRQVESVDGTRPQGELLDFGPPACDCREVCIAQIWWDGRVEREAAQVSETREWGKRGEGDVKLRREGVLERLTETSQGLEGKVGQGRMGLLGEDSQRGRPGVDRAGFRVRLQVDGVQPALWKVREKDFSSFRR